MQIRLQPAHELVRSADDTETEHLLWLTGEPAPEEQGQECWYLTLESGPIVIGFRVKLEI